ncbi:exonuclease domain-containing protein [Streptomyces sp. NPDC092952]|uniref:exonuclease domain-containing protein n=1 Tax=Streptomyces sp. NPDC092952 TaxID=3366018 RepID=UPI00380E909A
MDTTPELLNVIDIEATCWDGQPPPGAVSEIIEIGLTVVDLSAAAEAETDPDDEEPRTRGRAARGRTARGKALQDGIARGRVARHRILVRPARSSVSAFCTGLTGLTQAEVDTGVSFAEACRLLAAEHRAGIRPWASWGDYDRNQFVRQCRATGTPYPFGRHHTNAKIPFTAAHGLRKRPGMAQALEVAGLPLEGRHHSGADDAWNIAALVLDTAARGAWPAPDAR